MNYQQFKTQCRMYDPAMTCKKIKELYTFMYGIYPTSSVDTIAYNPPMLVDAPIAKCAWALKQKQEGNTPMTAKINFNTAMNVAAPVANIEATQRDFAVKRISDEKFTKRGALRAQFNMDAGDAPRNAKALIEAIKNDEFTLDEKLIARVGEDDLRYYNNQYGIIWGKNAPDIDGYKAAMKVLDTVTQAAIDEATLAPVEQLQEILKKYQAWVYTATA